MSCRGDKDRGVKILTLDIALFRLINLGMRNGILDLLMPFVSLAADKFLLAISCLFLFLFGRKKLKETALLAFLSLFTAGLLSDIFKNIFCRLRPAYILNNAHLLKDIQILSKGHSRYGFPSGHATAAFAIATILSAKYPRHKWLFFSSAILVGFSRVYMGMHFPSDVLAGAVLGSCVAIIALSVEKSLRSRLKP